MVIRKIIQSFAANIQTWSKTKIAVIVGVLFAGTYALLFFMPKNIAFSYAGSTCIGQLMLLPDQQRATDTKSFSVSYSGGFSIGKLRIATTKLCFTPEAAPAEGSTTVAIAPWGWYAFRSHYKITTPGAPKVLASKTTTQIAATKPLTFSISQTDTVYSYILSAGTQKSTCSVRDKDISCKITPLALAQGADHTVTLSRAFKEASTTLLTQAISILPAVEITASTPQQNQIVYDIPKSLTITTNKPLEKASAKLVQIEGDKQTDIEVETSVQDTTIALQLAAELVREKSYRLTVQSAEAFDGSTVTQPYILNFSTSGGPKVTGVSVGTSGVDPNARIVVTLDQAIASNVDITKFARIAGAGATVSKQGAQIIFTLSNVPRCTAFTLTVDKGITSGTNNLPSKDAWAYNSRVNCRATSVIGYSVKGRAITAYYYGSGSTTILFTGGMHGSEPSGQQTMQAWANYLDTHAQDIPAGKQVVIVPNTNPDGIASNSRYNSRGVNIDRNFSTSDWKSDIDTSSGTMVGGGGPSPMSEPETQAIGALTLRLNPRLEVSFHASGRLVGANDVGDSRSVGSLYASTVGYSTMFGGSAEETMGYSFSGQYEDYIGQQLGKPAILIELPSSSGNYLNSQLNALWKMVNL